MSAGYMTGIYIRELVRTLCGLFVASVKLVAVIALLLLPYVLVAAVERAVDSNNTVQPTPEATTLGDLYTDAELNTYHSWKP